VGHGAIVKSNNSKLPDFWLGFFVAAILVIATFVTITTNVNDFMGDIWPIILGAIIASLVIFTLFIFFRDLIFKRITGSSRVEFEEIQQSSENFVDAYVNQDKEAQLKHSVEILQNVGNWYLWIKFYRWVIATCTALLVAVAGFIGSVLLSQQNQIMQYETDISELNLMGEVRDSLKGAGTLEHTLRDVLNYNRYFGEDYSKIDYPDCNLSAEIVYSGALIRPDFGYLIPYLSDGIPEKRFNIPGFRESENIDNSRIISLLEYFLYDRDDSIVVSTIKFLDGQNSKIPHDDPIRLSNLLFMGIVLEQVYENEIFVTNSFLHSFSCKNCNQLRVSNSYYLLSDHAYNDVDLLNLENSKYSTSGNLVFVLPSHMSHDEFPERNQATYFDSLKSSYGDVIIINSRGLYSKIREHFKEDWEIIIKTNWVIVANLNNSDDRITAKYPSTTRVVSAPASGPTYYSDPNFYGFMKGQGGTCSEFEGLCNSNPFLQCEKQ